jgi:hypothetical protein
VSENSRKNSFRFLASSAAGVVSVLTLLVTVAPGAVHAQAVVTNGAFTNVYVLPDPDKETWEQHMAKLRPSDADRFSRAKIDKFTEIMMAPGWPSYFDPLLQYGIHPPQFFGSGVASQDCVDAAIKDELQGVLQWDTIRSLSNCHQPGMDPSPQVNLIFSPDFKIAQICGLGWLCTSKTDMCVSSTTWAWHAWGLSTPNFVALPTSQVCIGSIEKLPQHLSHEDVETVSDPGGLGINFGSVGPFDIPTGQPVEVADKCEKTPSPYTNANTLATISMEWSQYSLARYWSGGENDCGPRLDPPSGSVAATWILGQGSPLQTLKAFDQVINLKVPDHRTNTEAQLTRAVIAIQSGNGVLVGSSNQGDTVDVILNYSGGNTTTSNINAAYTWGKGETHAAELVLPTPAPGVNEITGVSITLHPGSNGIVQNWDVDKVALVVSFLKGSTVTAPPPALVDDWLDTSGIPLVRFTGNVHDFESAVAPHPHDKGKVAHALNVIISTGNDDLAGGSNPGDNCDVTLELASGKSIAVQNVNHGQNWATWTINTVPIPLPPDGIKGGEVKAIHLHTGFGGGAGGDNWNVQRVQLQATLAQVDSISPKTGPAEGGTSVTITGKGLQGATKVMFGKAEATHVQVVSESKLTADSPPAAENQANVEVETPVGEIANAGDDVFSYVPEVSKVSPDSGPFFGGTSVTVDGLALSDKYKFDFGGSPATTVKCSQIDKCTMLTPSHAPGKVPLKVEAPAGGNTKADLFNYLPPSITSFDPPVGPTTGGLQVTLTGVSLQDGTVVEFGDAGVTVLGCSGTTSCGVTSPPHAVGSVPLTATVDGVTSVPSSGEFTFKVFPTIVSISPDTVPANTGTLPVDVSVTLTGTGFSTNTGETVFNVGPSSPLKNVNCSSETTCTAIFINGPLSTAKSTTQTLPVTVTVNGITSLGSVNFTYPIQLVIPKSPPGP